MKTYISFHQTESKREGGGGSRRRGRERNRGSRVFFCFTRQTMNVFPLQIPPPPPKPDFDEPRRKLAGLREGWYGGEREMKIKEQSVETLFHNINYEHMYGIQLNGWAYNKQNC